MTPLYEHPNKSIVLDERLYFKCDFASTRDLCEAIEEEVAQNHDQNYVEEGSRVLNNI